MQRLFLLEAAVLAVAGGVGRRRVRLRRSRGSCTRSSPALPLATPAGAVVAALLMSLVVGIAAGVIPARRAAALDPVDALRAE